LLAPLPAASAELGGQGLDQLLRAFESSYRNVRTLRADFTQIYRAGGRMRRETGVVYLARGGRMRWQYEKPEEKLFISDGNALWLYLVQENQVRRSRVKSSGDLRVPFQLLLARPDLRRVFSRFELAARDPADASGNVILRAFPKGSDEDYSEVFIELTPMLDVRRLVISFVDHSEMEFSFERIERNLSLSSRLFRFTPPLGSHVIDQR